MSESDINSYTINIFKEDKFEVESILKLGTGRTIY